MNIRKLLPAVVALIAVLATTLPTLAASGDTVANARDATAAFNDPAAAIATGYDLLTDAAGIACIDQPGAGAMGIHYVKGALVQSGVIDTARPQAVVYELGENGRLHLVALEYVVLQAAWDGAHPGTVPTLFGDQKFTLTAAGNRYGLPAFYSLHAWIWKRNPTGTFSMWNPRVNCAAERAAGGHRHPVDRDAHDGHAVVPSDC